MNKLIRNAPTPIYVQLCDLIRKQMTTEGLQVGSPMPSETELMAKYGVSRTTVRLAVDRLVRAGMAVRVQGKGTFVAAPAIKQELVSLRSLSEALTNIVSEPRVAVVDLRLNPPVPPHVLARLELDSNDGVVWIRRVHLAKDKPVAFAVIYLSSKLRWDFTPSDLTHRSVYSWLEEEEQISVESIVQSITATSADDEVALHQGLNPGDPVLHVQNVGVAGNGVPIDYTDLYFQPDRYALTVKMHRTENAIAIASVRGNLPESRDQSEHLADNTQIPLEAGES
ncbi:MAG: GntR family transcriptional regulator [Anaerolineae bacterium]